MGVNVHDILRTKTAEVKPTFAQVRENLVKIGGS